MLYECPYCGKRADGYLTTHIEKNHPEVTTLPKGRAYSPEADDARRDRDRNRKLFSRTLDAGEAAG